MGELPSFILPWNDYNVRQENKFGPAFLIVNINLE